MSREIDPNTKKLSDYDKQYLEDRGVLPREEPVYAGTTLLKELPNTGDANTAGLTIEELEAELDRRREAEAEESDANQEKYQEALAAQGLDEESEPSADYTKGWTQDSRREELAKRGLSTEGSAKELVLRLRASDTD